MLRAANKILGKEFGSCDDLRRFCVADRKRLHTRVEGRYMLMSAIPEHRARIRARVDEDPSPSNIQLERDLQHLIHSLLMEHSADNIAFERLCTVLDLIDAILL